MSFVSNENRGTETSRVKKYFGGSGIIVLLIAAIVIIVSLVIDATTEIDSPRYVAIGAAIFFVVSTIVRAIATGRKDN